VVDWPTREDAWRPACQRVACQPLRLWGPAAPGHGPRLPGHPTGILKRAAQQHLDLGVEAAKFVIGLAGERVVDRWIDAQPHLFALTTHE
jgi:hypothetical protein